MRLGLLLAATLVMSVGALADDRVVDYDEQTDFARFQSFALRAGEITTRIPELQGPFVDRRIQDAIRAQLTSKGLSESQRPAGADLVVNYRVGAANQQETQALPAGRRGLATRRQTYRFTEGTLLIEIYERESREMIWRGIYRDDEGNAEKLAEKLPEDVGKLFEEFPPQD